MWKIKSYLKARCLSIRGSILDYTIIVKIGAGSPLLAMHSKRMSSHAHGWLQIVLQSIRFCSWQTNFSL